MSYIKEVVSRVYGVKTLRTQDTSDWRHFGTMRLVPNCLAVADTSVLVPNYLDLQQTFLLQYTEERFNITRYYY